VSRAKVLLAVDRAFLGGGQRTVLNLARGLDGDSFEVGVATEGAGPLVEELTRAGIPRFALKMTKSPLRAAAKALAAILSGEGFELVHTHGGVAGLHGRRAAAKAGIPAVHTLHGLHFLHYRNPISEGGHPIGTAARGSLRDGGGRFRGRPGKPSPSDCSRKETYPHRNGVDRYRRPPPSTRR
jgi:hypothetical protein